MRFLLPLALIACKSGDPPDTDPKPDSTDFAARGEYGVAHQTFTLDNAGRSLPVTLWYPAESDGGGEVYDFLDGEQQTTYRDLFEAAPAGCASEETAAAKDGTPVGGEWPLILFSHCHECLRFSSFSVVEHLVSHGFVVAAPDHTDNTLWNKLEGNGAGLDSDFLQTRTSDIAAVLAELQADSHIADVSFGPLAIMGHSFGAVTAGLVLAEQPEFEAGLALAAPMENPLIPGADIDDIDDPVLFLIAQEDNSITELGNEIMRSNHEEAARSWLIEVPDAGHWSFSDIAGLHEDFMPGCGTAQRQTVPGEDFTYLPVEDGIAIASETAAAFFSATLLGDPSGEAWLDQNSL